MSPPTTWNMDDNSDAILSNGFATASFGITPSTFHSVRSTTSKTSGKWMFVTEIDEIDPVGGWSIGVANSLAPLDLVCGATQDSAGAQFALGSNTLFVRNPNLQEYRLATGARNRVATYLDADNALVWWNNLSQKSGWTNANKSDFSGDPYGLVGGTQLSFDPSLGTYIIGSGFFYLGYADTMTLNPQCFGYTDIIPSLGAPWDELTIGFTVAQTC